MIHLSKNIVYYHTSLPIGTLHCIRYEIPQECTVTINKNKITLEGLICINFNTNRYYFNSNNDKHVNDQLQFSLLTGYKKQKDEARFHDNWDCIEINTPLEIGIQLMRWAQRLIKLHKQDRLTSYLEAIDKKGGE